MFRFFLLLPVFVMACGSQAWAQAEKFHIVQETRTIRCGYTIQPPFITQDPATGKIGGLFHDITEETGKRLNLKIEWTENVSGGQIPMALTESKFDMFCGMLWAMPARAGAVTFTRPVYYNAVNPCVAEKNNEYKKSAGALNAPEKTIIAFAGDVSEQIARNVFPQAEILVVPPGESFEKAMKMVVSGEADAYATCDSLIAGEINKAIGGGLKVAAPKKPITYIPVSFAMTLGDYKFKDMIDSAIFSMQADGTMRRLIAAHVGEGRAADTLVVPGVAGR